MTIRRALAVLLVCASAHTLVLGQDYKKVIELAQRVEKRLNTMISQEVRARRSAENEMRADLGKPQLPEVPEAVPVSAHEAPASPVSKAAPSTTREAPAAPAGKTANASGHQTPASKATHASGHETTAEPAGKPAPATVHEASAAPASKTAKATRHTAPSAPARKRAKPSGHDTPAPSAGKEAKASGHEAHASSPVLLAQASGHERPAPTAQETHATPASPAAVAPGHDAHATPAAKDPITRLQEGNRRFVEGRTAPRDFIQERPALTGGQHPFAIVLTCSDSRVPPELLFDESLGQIFVVRDAGNIVDSVVLGSIEYAAEHLHAGLLVVLGHEACGAVNATIKGGDVPPNIGSIVRRLLPPVEKVKAQNLVGVRVDSMCIRENVSYQVEQVTTQSDLLKSMVEEGHLRIVGGVYSLSTGEVTFLRGTEAAQHTGSILEAGPATAQGRKHGR